MFLKILQYSQENTCARVSSFVGIRPATLLKKSLWYRRFPVNFAKFLRTSFLQNTTGLLLLWIVCVLIIGRYLKMFMSFLDYSTLSLFLCFFTFHFSFLCPDRWKNFYHWSLLPQSFSSGAWLAGEEGMPPLLFFENPKKCLDIGKNALIVSIRYELYNN